MKSNEEGSALLSVLAVVIVFTTLAGILLSVNTVQYRFIRRDAHRLQARYAAEACVYDVIERIQADPRWRTRSQAIETLDNQPCTVTVEAFGGYLVARAEATYRRSSATVRAWIGEVPPQDFRNAVYLWDTESSFNVAGSTSITGDIVTGERGVKESSFKGKPFSGVLDGSVYRIQELSSPSFDDFVFRESIAWCETLLDSLGAPSPEPAAIGLPSENPIVAIAGDFVLTAADSAVLADPVSVVATGNLSVEGPLRLQEGSMLISGSALSLRGRISGRNVLLYGRERVDLKAGFDGSAQVISQKHVLLADSTYLRYPSAVYISGAASSFGGRIELGGRAVFDGSLIHPSVDPPPDIPAGRIVIGDSATVRGAVFNGLETEVHGTVLGSVVSHRLYFYSSPTNYVNWMKDAVVDVRQRPNTFFLPVAFSETPRVAVLRWETDLEER